MSRNRRGGHRPGPPPQAQQQPTGAPQDHRAPAAQQEAQGGQYVTVPWRGLEFRIPTPDNWDRYTVVIPIAMNNVMGAMGALLGPDQLIKMQRRYPDAEVIDFYDLFNEIAKATGYGQAGN